MHKIRELMVQRFEGVRQLRLVTEHHAYHFAVENRKEKARQVEQLAILNDLSGLSKKQLIAFKHQSLQCFRLLASELDLNYDPVLESIKAGRIVQMYCSFLGQLSYLKIDKLIDKMKSVQPLEEHPRKLATVLVGVVRKLTRDLLYKQERQFKLAEEKKVVELKSHDSRPQIKTTLDTQPPARLPNRNGPLLPLMHELSSRPGQARPKDKTQPLLKKHAAITQPQQSKLLGLLNQVLDVQIRFPVELKEELERNRDTRLVVKRYWNTYLYKGGLFSKGDKPVRSVTRSHMPRATRHASRVQS